MKYIHPKEYKGIRNQDRARQMVEDNCLKCSEFCGREHDFAECFGLTDRGQPIIGIKCPKPFRIPSINAKELIKCEVDE